MLHHPDHGGSVETMKAINNENDAIFEVLKSEHNARADADTTGKTKRAAVLDYGIRIGAALRAAALSERTEHHDGTHASPVAHIRRAHWHHFWTGPRDGERALVVRWLPPIPVNADEQDPEAVIIPIKRIGN